MRKKEQGKKEAGMVEAVDVSERSSHLPSDYVVTVLSLSITDDDRERDNKYGGRRGGRKGDRDRDNHRDGPPLSSSGPINAPSGPRADREKASSTPSSSTMPPPPAPSGTSTIIDTSTDFVPQMNDNDLNAIRSRYLGVDKKKRKIRKMNDRKFVFDWDEQDDTLAEDSPTATGANRQGAQIMFGRGHLAGMDDGGSVRRSSGNGELRFSDALERRKAAKAGFDERHWTEKPLNEMKERDWRIFREDFSIAARGQCTLYRKRTGH